MKKWLFCLVFLGAAVACAALVLEHFQPGEHQCRYNRKLYLTHPPLEGADVAELQERLKELGYYPGEITGIYDEATARAVREAQTDLELEPTGEAELWFWPLLYHGEDITQGEKTDPPPGEVHIEIYLDQLKLTVFSDGEEWASFPISPGRPATPSPMGEWRIVEKSYRPNDAFGTRWMRLNVPWGGYGVHGTNAPWSIGRVASLGCIRMYNKDVELIYPWIPIGTRVIITGNYHVQYKLPMREGRVGQDVVMVQWALRKAGFDPGEADGIFDADMTAAVKNLQRTMGLEPTGTVDETVFWLINLP
ncbi:MAG: L,D-transpeptidase family protein [Firmicutes bacterium]|nr:L,D-transpeptidase family protein [Bacillota bacterium]HOB35531.1 peptidoglycan-binding protein [Bacillota bacterium]HPZ90538.1 peptidoglycan-binding protein [Bacillota bacterium]HQE02628.1 peptidoglycan-binding protein [Bacillota bacterium]